MDRIYPRPDTTAAVCLDFIRVNPGCSQRAVVLHIGRNHTVVVKALAQLERHGLIEVAVNEYGHKAISAAGKWVASVDCPDGLTVLYPNGPIEVYPDDPRCIQVTPPRRP